MRTSMRAAVGMSVVVTSFLFLAHSPGLAGELASGDVLLGTSDGKIAQYRNGSHVGDLNTGLGAENSVVGLCVSTDGTYVFAVVRRGSGPGNVYRFDRQGQVQGIPQATGSWVALPSEPRACISDRAGNVYVAVAADTVHQQPARLLKYLPAGTLSSSFQPDGIGSARSIDLSSDQCVLVYSSAGRLKRFDVCSNVPLADLDQTVLAATCNALRLRGSGGSMIVCEMKTFMMSSTWQVQKTYEARSCVADRPNVADAVRFFSVNFAPNDQTFWASLPSVSVYGPRVCSLEVASGNVLSVFDPVVFLSTAVYGEQTAASKNCRRMFGRVLCLVRAFPYLQFHSSMAELPSVPRK